MRRASGMELRWLYSRGTLLKSKKKCKRGWELCGKKGEEGPYRPQNYFSGKWLRWVGVKWLHPRKHFILSIPGFICSIEPRTPQVPEITLSQILASVIFPHSIEEKDNFRRTFAKKRRTMETWNYDVSHKLLIKGNFRWNNRISGGKQLIKLSAIPIGQ